MKKVYAKAIRQDVVTAGHQILGNNMLMPEEAEGSISGQTRLPKVNEAMYREVQTCCAA